MQLRQAGLLKMHTVAVTRTPPTLSLSHSFPRIFSVSLSLCSLPTLAYEHSIDTNNSFGLELHSYFAHNGPEGIPQFHTGLHF